MIDNVMSESWGSSPQFNRLEDWKKRILLNYVERTGLTIYQQWSLNGRKENIDDVIKAAQKLSAVNIATAIGDLCLVPVIRN